MAAEKGFFEIAQLLLLHSRQEDLFATTTYGTTVMFVASKAQPRIKQLLMDFVRNTKGGSRPGTSSGKPRATRAPAGGGGGGGGGGGAGGADATLLDADVALRDAAVESGTAGEGGFTESKGCEDLVALGSTLVHTPAWVVRSIVQGVAAAREADARAAVRQARSRALARVCMCVYLCSHSWGSRISSCVCVCVCVCVCMCVCLCLFVCARTRGACRRGTASASRG